MDAWPGPPPLAIADEPIPSARGSKNLAEALSADSQCPGRNVTVLKIRNGGNYDYDERKWLFSEETGTMI